MILMKTGKIMTYLSQIAATIECFDDDFWQGGEAARQAEDPGSPCFAAFPPHGPVRRERVCVCV